MDSNAAGAASWKGEVDLPKASSRVGLRVGQRPDEAVEFMLCVLRCAVLRCVVLSKGELFGPSVTG
jgi:hypothetical protein